MSEPSTTLHRGVSRQTDYQEAHRKAGLCILCSAKRDRASRDKCAKHHLARRAGNRRRMGCDPWKPGGRGRPPFTVTP